MTTVFYVAATNKMSWGRGTKEWEAIAHALVHSGREATQVGLFRVECPEETREHQVYVNEMGGICAPKGTEVTEVGMIPLERILPKFFRYFDELDAALVDLEIEQEDEAGN